MSEVRRLVEGGASPAELALLEAAQADRPADDGARMRTLAALAAGAAATGALAAGAGKAVTAPSDSRHRRAGRRLGGRLWRLDEDPIA